MGQKFSDNNNALSTPWQLMDSGTWLGSDVGEYILDTSDGPKAVIISGTTAFSFRDAANDWLIMNGGTNKIVFGNAVDNQGYEFLGTGTLEADGHIIGNRGIRTLSPEFGASIVSLAFGTDSIVQAGEGWYDHTGGTYENMFTKTSGANFTSENIGDWIVFTTGAKINSVCEIKLVIDTETAIVDGMGWTEDINSGVSPGNYFVSQHPSFITGDGYKHEFSCGSAGEFEVVGYDFAGGKLAEFEFNSAANNQRGIYVGVECEGHNNIVGQEVHIKSGDLGVGESVAGIYTHVDVSEATNADASTSVPCYIAGVEDGSNATTKAFLALAGFSKAFQVYGASAVDPGYGYENTSGLSGDRVNGGTADTTAFLSSSGSDLTIMDNDDDYILIGSDEKFEIVDVALDTGANQDAILQFFYSKSGGNWTALTVVDTTGGMRENGQFNFTAPADWTEDDEDMDGNAIIEAYYIAIQRTRNALVQPPIEDYFKIRASKDDGMEIRGDGVVKLPYLAAIPSDPENGMIWMESDGLHAYYGNAEHTLS